MEEEVKSQLYRFFSAMHEWEKGNAVLDEISDGPDFDAEAATQAMNERWAMRMSIFDRYCLYQGKTAGYGSMAMLYEYSPEDETIDTVTFPKEGEALVETTRRLRGMTNQFQYTLRCPAGEWKVVDNRLTKGLDGSWEDYPL